MERSGLLLLFTTFLLNGCSGVRSNKNMQVLIIGGSSLPSSVSGLWKADRDNWMIEIQKDGTVSRIIHAIGITEVFNGQAKKFPLIDNGDGYVQPGKWILQYDHQKHELTIEINLSYFEWNRQFEKVYGRSRDILTGPITPNGTWHATWLAFPEYFVTTDEVSDYQLPVDEGSEDRGIIVFTKR